MEQNKKKFWKKKVKPILRQKKELERMYKKRIEKIDFENRSERWGKEKIRIANKVGDILKKIPSVKFVGVSGSVASDWPKKNDDIDLLIISSDNHLWINRIIIIVLLKIFRFELRKKNNEKINSLCLNMWLEERSMMIEKSRQNLLTALDLVWLKSIVNKENYWQKFLTTNSWAKNMLSLKIKKLKISKKNKKNYLAVNLLI